MVTDSSASLKMAAPLKPPAFLASFTIPVTSDPAGMTTSPPTLMAVKMDPVNTPPVWLVLLPKAWFVRMVTLVPAGTTSGLGGGSGGGAGEAATGVGAALSEEEGT